MEEEKKQNGINLNAIKTYYVVDVITYKVSDDNDEYVWVEKRKLFIKSIFGQLMFVLTRASKDDNEDFLVRIGSYQLQDKRYNAMVNDIEKDYKEYFNLPSELINIHGKSVVDISV